MHKINKNIYLDYSATTPCDLLVLEKMIPYFTDRFGNSSSRSHSFGWDAEVAVEKARAQIATCLKVEPKNIIFTSGATESNNIAIKGAAEYLKINRGKNHIITLEIEHKCVIDSCAYLENRGFEVTYLKVGPDGIVDLELFTSSIKENTGIVSIAWVHNEIGVIQPVHEIAEICRARGIIFHTDAAQALGRVPIDMHNTQIDLMSLSGHKIYAPKGIGVLYKRSTARLAKVISGGGQESGLRSGTIPVPLCVGMGEAAEMAVQLQETEWNRMTKLQDYMYTKIMQSLGDVHLNGSFTKRIPHNLNFSFGGVEGESLMMTIPHIAVSSGSACTSGSLEPSYVISALGLEHELVHTAIRIVIGRYTTFEEIEQATHDIIEAVNKRRAMSPLWHMKQQGIDLSTVHWTE